jgi:hypothetical protein
LTVERRDLGQPVEGAAELQLQPQLEMRTPAAEAAGAAGAGSARRAVVIAAGLLALAAIGAGVVFSPLLRGDAPSSDNRSPPSDNGSGSGTSLFTRVPAGDVERALAMLALTAVDKGKVRELVKAGTMRLAWVTVSDFDEEDGDWVAIAAGGFRQDVRLFKTPLTIAVPYLPGVPARVIGLIDGGGGGITVAVHVGGHLFSLKPLQIGESIEVPTP